MDNRFFNMGFTEDKGNVFFNEGLFSKFFLEKYDFKYCDGDFYIYEDNYWNNIDDLKVKKMCKDCFDNIEEGVWRISYERKYFPTIITDVKKVEVTDLNKYPFKMNFENGVYNFKTCEFEDHDKENYFTYIQNYGIFNSNNETPYFDMLLSTLSDGNHELRLYLLRLMAYLISGIKTEQRFFLLKSSGNSGKSTFINLVIKLLTQSFVSSISMGRLEDRFSLGDAVGKKIIISAETEVNEKVTIGTETLKKLTGGDLVRVERKYKEPYSAYLKVELLFSTNSDSINFVDISEGLKRRLTIVETAGVVSNPIVDFDDKLGEEIPDIMVKLIDAFADIHSNESKIPMCSVVENATEVFKKNLIYTKEKIAKDKEIKIIGEEFYSFFEEHLVYDSEAVTSKNEVYKSYERNGGKESTTKFWTRFDKWTAYKKYNVIKTEAPNRVVKGIKIVSDIKDSDLENLF